MSSLCEVRSLFRKRTQFGGGGKVKDMETQTDRSQLYSEPRYLNGPPELHECVHDASPTEGNLHTSSELVFVGDDPFQENTSASRIGGSKFLKYRIGSRELPKRGDKFEKVAVKTELEAPELKQRTCLGSLGKSNASSLCNTSPIDSQTSSLSAQPKIKPHTVNDPEQTEDPEATRIVDEEQLFVPIDSSWMPSKEKFKCEYSPTGEWTQSPSASISVLRAEVSRLEALNDDANKAIDRAHHQIEEQELFALSLQKQVKTSERDLQRKEEQNLELESRNADLQEQLTNLEFRHQLDLKEEERREHEKELQRQIQLVQKGDSELAVLKDEYYQLQKSLRNELNKLEHSASEEHRLRELVETLKKEHTKLTAEQTELISENGTIQESYSELENTCSEMKQVITELDAENNKLKQDLNQEKNRTQGKYLT
eukprot:g1353.t1